jgi:hypothetical protein
MTCAGKSSFRPFQNTWPHSCRHFFHKVTRVQSWPFGGGVRLRELVCRGKRLLFRTQSWFIPASKTEGYRIWKWLPFHNEITEMPQNETLGYLMDGEHACRVKFNILFLFLNIIFRCSPQVLMRQHMCESYKLNILFHKVFQIWFLYQEIVPPGKSSFRPFQNTWPHSCRPFFHKVTRVQSWPFGVPCSGKAA